MNTPTGIESFVELIPPSLMGESGKVFYSGREAFSSPAPLYVLGVNPGGNPENHKTETVQSHTRQVVSDLPFNWSAYRDESWEGAAPGTHGMAPRVLHLIRRVGLDPGKVPASNLFFVRSSRETHMAERQAALKELCWPFHALVIGRLRPRIVLCLGGTAGKYVRQKLAANRAVGQFVEQNNRRWISRSFENVNGLRVVVATHPGRANWCAQATDPTELLLQAFQ